MNVLVTGNLGYIGSVLTDLLITDGFKVTGLDAGYFDDCLQVNLPRYFRQIYRDIRDVLEEDLRGIDYVIHLAGLSNDPLGELAPGLTEEINYQGTVKFANLCKASGVKRFIYASSQSMYGVSNSDSELDEDLSDKNPVTSYAKTKWDAELALNLLSSNEFMVCSFRPSTVFGVSPRLRCDIVFNNFVASAYTTNKIEIKSDGTPWRPVVHVRDVCMAFMAGLKAPKDLLGGRAFNVGIPNGNFSVRELAEAAQRAIPGSELVFTGEHGKDSRTYKVSFRRILSELSEYFRPQWNLDMGAQELVRYFNDIKFTELQFKSEACNRLAKLNALIQKNKLNDTLRYKQ